MTSTKSNEYYRKLGEKIAELKEKEGLPYVTIGPKMGFSDSYASKIYHKYKAGEYDEVKSGEDVKKDLDSAITQEEITELLVEDYKENEAFEEEPFHTPLTVPEHIMKEILPKTEKVTCIVSHVDKKRGEWLPSIHVDIEIPTGLEGDKRTAVMHNEVVKFLMCEEL